MSDLRIGVDIDDVLYPFYDQAHLASISAGITNGITPSTWSPYTDYGCSDQEWFDALSGPTLDGSLYFADPFPGAVEAMQEMADRGWLLHLVTARGALAHGELIRKHTIDWLHAHQIPFDSLTFSSDKTIVDVDVFIEDHPKNAEALVKVGRKVVLIDRPYNRECGWGTRAQSMADVPALLMAEDAS